MLAPQVIAEKNGAEILRLWVASSDFTEDLRIGQDIIKANVDAYRRLRNTIRFMLANLAGFDEKRAHRPRRRCRSWSASCWRGWPSSMRIVREAYAQFDFNRVYTALFNFCTNDLSAFYFDIRKDALYCDARPMRAPPRRAHRDRRNLPPHRHLVRADPVLHHGRSLDCALPGDRGQRASARLSSPTPAAGPIAALIEKWNRASASCAASSPARWNWRARDKIIGASLEAAPIACASTDAADKALFETVDLAEIAITSARASVEMAAPRRRRSALPDVPGRWRAASITAQGDKCARCWRVLEEVGPSRHPISATAAPTRSAPSEPA